MNGNQAEKVPELQPPGAGLPWYERIIGGRLLRRQARHATRASSAALFAREHANISRLVAGFPRGDRSTRVLIPRLRGMEDSSRYWSVHMTLDHLRIVNHGTGELIRLLGAGRTPARVTGTADVKPSPDADESVVEAFEQACAHFERCVAAIENLHGTPRWPHPWFGPLDAADWHFFTAFHLRLHHQQMEAIRRGM